MTAIQVRNLSKKYGDFLAVNNLSFDLPAGQIIGLLGGNGAGKTTTISMLLGALLPSSGSISVLGHDMRTQRHAILARMNFSSPYVDLPYRLTIRQNLTVFSHLYNVPNFRERIDHLAEELNLTTLLNKPYGDLSAGQKTRASLAKSLINSPDILLLDEPTASLDPDTADWVRSFLMEYQQRSNATIVLASHNMQEVERMCHDTLVMKSGMLIARGLPAELVTRYGRQNLEEVFLHLARNDVEQLDMTTHNTIDAIDANKGAV